ncbi:MAG: aldehyde dehydrogenase, partial [Anaerolineae bacterium]|nr:aldehyde dehydrogenase [Anaerolineae bacterium]
MTVQPVLIAGTWRSSDAPVGTFQAVNPATKLPLPEIYPVSSWEETELTIKAAAEAAEELRDVPPEARARFLETFADNIEARADTIASLAHLETGLA